jgi:hypothetical protein
MMEIPYVRGSKLPSDSVKFSLTKDGIVYSAMLQHLVLTQTLTVDGKKVYVSFSIPEIQVAEVLSMNAKKVIITDLKCENLLVRLKWM